MRWHFSFLRPAPAESEQRARLVSISGRRCLSTALRTARVEVDGTGLAQVVTQLGYVKVIRRSLFHIAANIIGNFNWLWFR